MDNEHYTMNKLTSFLIILPNIFIVTTLFWALTLVGQYFYKAEDSVQKKENFECGFENVNLGESTIDFKNATVMSFLVLYDIELLLLLPVSFSIEYSITHCAYQVLIVMTTIIITCVVDLEAGTLEYDN